MKFICTICGGEYVRPPHRMKETKYCSKKCQNKAFSEKYLLKNKPPDKIKRPRCLDCGKFTISYTAKRCRKCSDIFHKGSRNNLWKGGITPVNKIIRSIKKYRDWRLNVFERDNYICQHCGIRGGNLEAHHVIPFCANKNLRFNLSNGLTLCKDCHRKTDSYSYKGGLTCAS